MSQEKKIGTDAFIILFDCPEAMRSLLEAQEDPEVMETIAVTWRELLTLQLPDGRVN